MTILAYVKSLVKWSFHSFSPIRKSFVEIMISSPQDTEKVEIFSYSLQVSFNVHIKHQLSLKKTTNCFYEEAFNFKHVMSDDYKLGSLLG